MIDTILTDLDGVIRIWPPENAQQAENQTGLPEGSIRKAAFSSDLLHPVITGQTSDDQWRRQIAKRLGRLFPNVDTEQAVQLWSESSGEIDSEVIDILRECRKKAQIVLISNATSRLPSDLQRLGIAQEFDHVVNSSEIGHIKPQPEIYSAALNIAGASAQQTFFVDDNAENAAAAVRVGMTGYTYAGADLFRQELDRLGLL